MPVIGLTGGIASGKSTLASMMKKKGAVVIDADRIAREETEPGKPAYQAIVSHFGRCIVNSDGKINRKKLGRIVFSDPDKLSILNELTHGPIIEKIKSLLGEVGRVGKQCIIVIEVPLLIESGLSSEVDKIVVVMASEPTRLQRLLARGVSEKEAVDRLGSQISDKKRQEFSDYVIENNGTVEELEAKAEELWENLGA